MAKKLEYIKEHYGIDAYTSQRVIACGKPGIIAEDRGHYVGVNLDEDKPGIIGNYHPEHKMEYLNKSGTIRKMTAGQKRYREYLHSDTGLSFTEWLGIKNKRTCWNCYGRGYIGNVFPSRCSRCNGTGYIREW